MTFIKERPTAMHEGLSIKRAAGWILGVACFGMAPLLIAADSPSGGQSDQPIFILTAVTKFNPVEKIMPVHILLTNDKGQRAGVPPGTDQEVNEIDEARYSSEWPIASADGVGSEPPTPAGYHGPIWTRLLVDPLAPGHYEFLVWQSQATTYAIELIVKRDEWGAPLARELLTGTVAAGKPKKYTISASDTASRPVIIEPIP